MKAVTITQITPRELEILIEKSIKKVLVVKTKESLSKTLISIKDITKHFGVSKPTIYKWKRCGILPEPIKVGGRVYYLKAQVEDLLISKSRNNV